MVNGFQGTFQKHFTKTRVLMVEKLPYSPEFIGTETLTVIEMGYSWELLFGDIN